jgi:hypothetical protein
VALRWSTSGARLVFGKHTLHADAIDAVWWRRPVDPSMPSDRSPPEAEWATNEAQAALAGFWDHVNARWVSHPRAIAAAAGKPEQLLRARRAGFDVPETLITNTAAELREFAAAHEPKLYDVRVTVVGDDAFACRILSQEVPTATVDWRHADVTTVRHERGELDAEVVRADQGPGPALADRDGSRTRGVSHLPHRLRHASTRRDEPSVPLRGARLGARAGARRNETRGRVHRSGRRSAQSV